jgi:hypothetical protein
MNILKWIENNALGQLAGFLFGIAASFIASIVYQNWYGRRHYKEYASLVGVWIEANDVLTDRPFAVCEFFFSPSDGKLKFTGDSYDNSAQVHYDWSSVVLYIDDRERRISYIYETKKAGKTEWDEGFGCYKLSFDDTKKRWGIARGYFQDLEEANPRHCRMRRFEDVCKVLKLQLSPSSDSDRKMLIKKLLQLKSDTQLRTFFGW